MRFIDRLGFVWACFMLWFIAVAWHGEQPWHRGTDAVTSMPGTVWMAWLVVAILPWALLRFLALGLRR